MNAEKCVNVLGNIFHFETVTGENGNYELSSNYWDLRFNVRIREFTIVIQNGRGTRCSPDTDEDENTIARELVSFIGDVLKDVSKTFVYDGTNGILAWPYNCNFAYIDKLKECMDMNEGESETYDRVESSRKPIKSGFAQRNAGMIMDKLDKCNQLIETCISISPDARLTRRLEELEDEVDNIATQAEMLSNGDEQIQSSRKVIKSGFTKNESEFASLMNQILNEENIANSGVFPEGNYFTVTINGDYKHAHQRADNLLNDKLGLVRVFEDVTNQYDDESYESVHTYMRSPSLETKAFKKYGNFVESSMQGQERGIQAIMDEYGCTREEALEIMNGEVTSGCHGKAKKKAKKPVKSSASSWEAGYNACQCGEGYADYPTGLSNSDAEDWMSGWDYANREAKGELTEAELEQVWSEDDEERLRGQFADERGLNLNEDEFPEDEYEDWVHQGAAMYSSVTRNHKNIQALYN